MNKKTIDLITKDPQKYAMSLKINDLVDILKNLSDAYYNTDTSLISDEVYDILKDTLEERDPTNDYLKEIGAPIVKDKVPLPYFMPSLDKIKPDTDVLEKWLKKFPGPYVLSDKLDGVSALLYKDEDGKIKLYTRGDGKEGQNITHLIPYVINKNIDFTNIPKNSAIRGELIISKNDFKKISDNFKNARNTVAGLVNAKKNFSQDVAAITKFVAYAVIKPRLKQKEQMEKLEEWKFPMASYLVKNNLTNDMLSEYLVKRRKESPYEVDGIVVIDSSKAYDNKNNNPDYGFAFKTVLTDQTAEATVIDVLWDVSKHGYLTPTVQIKPITLVGVEITYATAFNAKFVQDNVLGPGAIIKLVRSGDVIPHILEVIKPSASGKPKMPDTSYYWNDTKINIIVKDIHGDRKDRMLVKQITSFFKTLEIKFISEGIVTKFVENGYKSVIDIIKAKNKLTNIDGVGDVIIAKIFTNIDNAFKNVTLYQLMAASNVFGRGFGTRRLKMITNTYPDILKSTWTKKEMIDKVQDIAGFDTLTATQFTNNFDEFKLFYSKLEKVVDLSNVNKKKTGSATGSIVGKTGVKFKDMIIVFSGVRDKELEKIIEDNGGKVTTTVSSNTTTLVYSDVTTSKYLKAIELKIPTLTIDEFKKKYKVD